MCIRDRGTIVGGFAHAQVLALADQIVDAVKSGAIKKFVVMAGDVYKRQEIHTIIAWVIFRDIRTMTETC